MSVTKKFVLLLKAQKNDEDEYEVMLKSQGYIVEQIKTIDFNYVRSDEIKSKLLKPNDYSGIIFSSPRCVNAVKLALNHNKLLDDWKLKDNYVVGETTYKTALKELDLNCLGRDTGNADVLSQIMLREREKYTKAFLYPHGNLKMDILKNKFTATNLNLDEVLAYETIPNANVRTEFENITNNFTKLPEYMILFSPSGVKAIEDVLVALPVKLIKMIAIGPTTEAAMLQAGVEVFGTAEKPTAQHVLHILLCDK